MRVGLVCPYDWSVPGGVQAQVAGLAGQLCADGLDVVVIGPDSSRFARRRHFRRDGGARSALDGSSGAAGTAEPYLFVAAGRSVAIPVNGSMAPVAPTPAAMARTVRALWRLRPDVVHVHEPLAPGPSLAAMLGGPRPIVATFHRAGTDVLYRAGGRLLGAVMGRADCTVAVSQAAAETATAALGRRGPGNGLVIVPNGVDLGYYAGVEAGAGESAAASRPTIVFVGRHEDRKGLRTLLEALAALPAEVRLEVLGDGPRSAELRRSFDDARISWRGAVNDEDKARHLAAADIFVAPSIEGESFGVVLLEAMAAGTAVVASDLPGYRSAAGEGAAFVPPGDPLLLAAALTRLLADPAERSRLEASGLEVARAHSIQAQAARYEELYTAVRRLRPASTK